MDKPLSLEFCKTSQEEQKTFIKRFMRIFFTKFGYYPTVIMNKKDKSNTNLLSLNQLSECFKPFLPQHYGKTLPISHKSRTRELTELRHMFCYIARSMNFKMTTIGQFLDNRDHSTVINSIRVFENLYQTDDIFREKYERIIKHIKETYESSIMESVDKVWN